MPAVPDAARTAVVDRRQLTGKMKSTALEKNTTGSASPRRTIVPVSATRESMCPMCNAAADESRDDRRKSEQATKLALAEQVFTDLLWALAENSAQTD